MLWLIFSFLEKCIKHSSIPIVNFKRGYKVPEKKKDWCVGNIAKKCSCVL